jgi:hypothetical protein
MSSHQEKTDLGHDNPSLELNGEIPNGQVTKQQLMQEQQQHDQLMHDHQQQHEQQIVKEGKSDSRAILILSGDDLFEDLPAQGTKSYKVIYS